ncbi:hypothetical protein HYH02_008519 [Chlamydomonas schloesseri]|uniref:Sfi1 spindle body domain-containing protein n=1 Tax=Chlamydomonas schloesseri TaxID=2026947 RepID=A0A835WFI5_9CHLO|nr:hypothetical protein HYH02_008519 [Chlamydomonas schloesseri]|eukprot:KAG2446532.1 hypothetical protein HYH02_008519 [Chlamydomonas schloesseri]
MPKGRPEDVFREAKKLVEEVRLSRQRSPQRLGASTSVSPEPALGLHGSALSLTDTAYPPAALKASGYGRATFQLSDARLAAAKDGLGGAAASLVGGWLASNVGDAAPSVGGDDDLGRAWAFQAAAGTAVGARRFPGRSSPAGKSAAFAAGKAAEGLSDHGGDTTAAGAEGGDVTPSRWQKLTQRVNAAEAAVGAGLSPQRASQLLQPSSPVPASAAGAASVTGAAGIASSQSWFPDQPSKAARLSSPSSTAPALPYPGPSGGAGEAGGGWASTALGLGSGPGARAGSAARDSLGLASYSFSLLHSATGDAGAPTAAAAAGTAGAFGGYGSGSGGSGGGGAGGLLLSGLQLGGGNGDGGGGRGFGLDFNRAGMTTTGLLQPSTGLAGLHAGYGAAGPRVGAGAAAYGGSTGATASTGKALSPYERAVAALQQAEQQLREHQQHKGATAGADGARGAVSAAEAPANAALLAAERFLRGGAAKPGPAKVSATGAGAGPRGVALPSRPAADSTAGAGEGSFEDVAMGMLRRLTAAAPLGGPPAVAPPLLRTYTALEPPPAQHMVAAAALAAAKAAAATQKVGDIHSGAENGAGGGHGEQGGLRSAVPGGVATAVSRAAAPAAAPELEFQITMQGLMSAAHRAASEEALQAARERRRREAAAAAEAEIAAAEERTVALLRRALYLHLWRMAAGWGRREAQELRWQLAASKARRCLAAWHQAARVQRLERLAEEALELAAGARRLQVADQFRRLALMHRSLLAWRAAAEACAQERAAEQEEAMRLRQEQHADTVREAAADRFRCLWLLHSCLRTWRTTARARAAARATLGSARAAWAGGGPGHAGQRYGTSDTSGGGGGPGMAGAAPAAAARAAGAGPSRAALSGRERDQHRRAAVEALLGRLKSQREAFMQDGTGNTGGGAEGGGGVAAAEPRPATATAASAHPPASPRSPHGVQARPATASPAPPPPHAAFPGLNRFVRPAVMRDGVALPGQQPRGSSGSSGGAAARATRPQPFKLSTDRRAVHRRQQVLSACEATRQLVVHQGGGEPAEDAAAVAAGAGAAASAGGAGAHGQWQQGASRGPEQQWQQAANAAAEGGAHSSGAGGAVGGGDGGWCGPTQHAPAPAQAWAGAVEEGVLGDDDQEDAGSVWSEGGQQATQEQHQHQQHPGDAGQEERLAEEEADDDAEQWEGCSVSSSLQQGSARWGAEAGEEGEEEGSGSQGAAEQADAEATSLTLDGGHSDRWLEQPSAPGTGLESEADGAAAFAPAQPQDSYLEPGGGVRPQASGDAAAPEDDGRRYLDQRHQPARHHQQAWQAEGELEHPQQPQQAPSALVAQPSHRSLHSSCSASSPQQQQQQSTAATGSTRAAGPHAPQQPTAVDAAAPHRSAHHTASSTRAAPSRPASARLPPGTWRPPSPPKDATRPTTAGSSRPTSAARDNRRGSLGGGAAAAVTAGRRGGPTSAAARAAATSILLLQQQQQQVEAPVPGAGVALGPALTAADVEKLRAAEVRRRRQADEKARALAAELAAHMNALAEAHHRRSLLLWFGVTPWIQLVLLARQQRQVAQAHRDLGLMRAALLGFARAVVRARMQPAAEQAAAVSRGRYLRRSRLALAVLDRLSAAAAAAGLHRRHLAHRVLLGFMRNASDAWSARADAEEFATRRRLWSCFKGWRQAAEEQASSRLLWELQAQHDAERALGRRRAARVLAAWRRLTAEGTAQRAELQARSQKWAKVQGWLREVHQSRASGAGSLAASASGSARSSAVAAVGAAAQRPLRGAGAASTAGLPPAAADTVAAGGLGAGAESLLQQPDPMRLKLCGEFELPPSLGGDWGSEVGGGTGQGQGGGASKQGGGGAAAGADVDDPLGLGPIEEQLQQFSLGPSGIASLLRQQQQQRNQAPAGSPLLLPRPGGGTPAPGRGEACLGRDAGEAGAGTEGSRQRRAVGPPASRQERLARYLQGRSGGGAAGAC